jgi:hypothetical protein
MTTSEVAELIDGLRAGQLTLGEVAQRFRERAWPEKASRGPQPQEDLDARALADPDPYVPGSFEDVLVAFDRHDLTMDEYEVLAQAAAEGMKAGKPAGPGR